MSAIVSQITSLTIVYSTVYSGADPRKHKSSASLAFVWGIYRWPVNSPHKGPVTQKMLPFDDVIMGRYRREKTKPHIKKLTAFVLTGLYRALFDHTLDHAHTLTSQDRQGDFSPALRVLVQRFVPRANIKETSNDRITGLLCRESNGDRSIPCTKGHNSKTFSMSWRHHVN